MDLHTLHMEHAVVLGLFCVLTLINCRMYQGVRGMYWFPVYTLLALIGAILVALRGRIPDPVSIVFGMMFFHLAYLCLYRCLADFFEGASPRWSVPLQMAVVGGSIVALVEYGAIHPETHKRLIVTSLVFMLQLGLSAWLLFRNGRAHLRISSTTMGIVVSLLGLNYLIRAVSTMLTGAPANYLNGGPVLQWVLLSTTVLQGGITVAFVWMTAAVLQEDLRRLAATDPLTGLMNRRAIEVTARQTMALSLTEQTPLAAILVDLDHFKKINDTYGHAFGDRTLMDVAHCLQRNMRGSDLLGRIGGDEFAIVLPNTDAETALGIAERLRGSLASLHVTHGGFEAPVSASIGLAQLDQTTSNWEELIVHCDRALYAVKKAGGNLVLVH